MKKIFIFGIVAVLVLSFLSACAGPAKVDNIQRTNVITLEGKPLTLLGPELKVGQKAPDFKLVTPYEGIELYNTAKQVGLADSRGKVRLISVVPSLDTPVCDLQTQRFEEEAGKYATVAFYTISMDLPFAQARYCGAKKVSLLEVLSDYQDGSFGLAYGVLVKEFRLLSRAIFIIDQNDVVRYVEYVREISQPPDYDAALAALQALVGPPPAPPAPTSTVTPPVASPLPQPQPSPTATLGALEGNLAPDFQLTDMNGKTVSLSGLRGQPVMLDFWATWCPFCQGERPLIQQIYDEWRNKGLNVLTIDIIGSRTTETPENLTSFMQEHKYTFPVLLDTNRDATKSYNIKFTPTNLLIDKNGIIRKVTVGPFASKAAFEEALRTIMP